MMLNVETNGFHAVHRDLACESGLFMEFAVLRRDLSKSLSEDRDFVFNLVVYLAIVPERHLRGLHNGWRLQGNSFVAILLRDLDAAIPVVVLNIATAEDY
jgi:hypothetical protein